MKLLFSLYQMKYYPQSNGANVLYLHTFKRTISVKHILGFVIEITLVTQLAFNV